MPKDKKLYDVLGVDPDATPEEIKQAHHRLVKKVHPDAGGDKEEFHKVQGAYLVLRDPERREKYDKHGAEAVNPDNETALILTLLGGLMQQALASVQDPTTADIVGVMKDILNKTKSGHDDKIVECMAQDYKLRELEKRFKKKNKKNKKHKDHPNYFQTLLAGQRAGLKKQITNFKEAIEQVDELLDIVDAFEYVFDAPPQPSGGYVKGWRPYP
jgi:curved DNA-binding protein CbpA